MVDSLDTAEKLEKILLENPDDHRTRIELATHCMYSGDYYSAAYELQKVVKKSPPSPMYVDAYYQLGIVLRTLGNFPEALKCMGKVIEADETNGNAFYYSGLLQSELGDHKKAAESLQRSISLLPQQSYLHYALGNTHLQLGNGDEAIKEFQTALTLSPKDTQIRNSLGLCYILKGDYPRASAELGEALLVNPKDPTANFLYSWVKIRQEEEIEAIEKVEKFVHNDPSNPLGHLTLSALHQVIGEYSMGEEAYRKGAKLLKIGKDPVLYSAIQVISSSLNEIAREKNMLEEDELLYKDGTVKAFQEIMGLKSPALLEKSRLTASLSQKMAQENKDFDDSEIEDIRIAGTLCNLGMAFVPDTIVNKEEKLTDDEKKVLATHPLLSQKVLQKIESFADVVPLIRHHHERHNGSGFPDHLKGDDIPLGAGIVGLADFYVEITVGSKRQRAATKDEALRTINTLKGNFFSHKAVELINKALSSPESS
ncbi:MAG: tetratricopeptide repeat protein [Candidatus Eremiobacteraeota bacterium]|nr:tetratricopeptide repeat protein [Candidatus Eremiobacteraeota bacterium]